MQSAPRTDDNAALCALSDILIIRNKNAHIRGIEKLGNIEKTNDPKNLVSVTETCSYTDARVYMCVCRKYKKGVWVL